ncbi:VirK/YbjX family protein [unidentified bacterial endosymbiont]|uniref:VirK/YbjX family protein n=1 Tax=unidentified bacterial endosymbiont TaxID=2355 RepID=UPI00209D582F|nr:VirK/YbjX family protein [unidentified bacterial endosymbiont]
MSNTQLHHDVLYPHRTTIISELVTGKCVPGPIWQKRNYRLKFLLRSILFWSSTHRMLEALSGRDDFERLLASQITLPSKTHRQYLMRGLNASDRADAIVSHYQWIDGLKDAGLAHALTSPQELPVVQFQAKNEAMYTVKASSARKAEREGESTLWLYDQQDTLLASLTFSVAHSNGRRVLVIGGLQGPRRNVSREVIKQATRACHGLFPKRILMEVILQLAAHTTIRAIFAVSDEGHVFRALRYRLSKSRYFHASYDEFWSSLEGKKLSTFCWQLPLQTARKSLEEVASKKRAEYRRRFALLDQIENAVNAFLSTSAKRP